MSRKVIFYRVRYPTSLPPECLWVSFVKGIAVCWYLQRMDNLNLPNVPRKRRSTNQLDVASCRNRASSLIPMWCTGSRLAVSIGQINGGTSLIVKLSFWSPVLRPSIKVPCLILFRSRSCPCVPSVCSDCPSTVRVPLCGCIEQQISGYEGIFDPAAYWEAES